MKICFLASGNGGNLKFFYLIKKFGLVQNIKLFVIADRACGSIEFAKNHNIYCKIIAYTRDKNTELIEELEKINPNIIVTNWHKIIDNGTVKKYKGKMINLHYSLLPAFGGLIGIKPIQKAYENNCQFIGVTCHYINEHLDSGKIISQAIIKADIPIEVAIQKVFEKGCLILLNSILKISDTEIIRIIENNKFEYSPNLVFDDKFFDDKFWIGLEKL